MKKRKLRRLVRRMVEDAVDREQIGREMDRLAGVPSDQFEPLTWPNTGTITWPWVLTQGTSTVTVRCTCPPNRGDRDAGTCLIHDVQVSS